MSDLIDRQALREDVEKIYKYDCQTFVVHYPQVIDDLSSTEPEQKKGKWINGRCDQCGEHAPFWAMASTYYLSNFCQNCGADMRGE